MLRSAVIVFLFSVALVAYGQSYSMGLTGKVMLLAMNPVKKEINLTKDQEKQINGLMSDAQKNPSSLGFPDMHYMTRSLDAKVDAILDPVQAARLQELFLQYNGLLTLSEVNVCDALGLTDETRVQAKAIVKEHDKTVMDELMAHRGKVEKKKMDAMHEKSLAGLAALLTPEQAETWKTIQGKPFKFPKMGP